MCLLGEILTATAKKRGAAGAVINGYHRDTKMMLEQNFPVFQQRKICTGFISKKLR